jgi:tRNA (guanine-N7-)-methyltransferase
MTSLLPRIAVDVEGLRTEARSGRLLRLEIGFGGGEHLAHEALAHPDVDFIGCEPFENGVAKLMALVEEHAIGNVRVHCGDARDVIDALPDGSLDRVAILYPDPWPKLRHRKRRFVSDATLRAIARVLSPGAELRFATDIDDYAGWTLARVLRSDDFEWKAKRAEDWLTPWAGWPGTRYEAKAIREGRRPVYLTFIRR